MKFNPLKTRLGRLEQKLKVALAKPSPDLKEIIAAVEDYEIDNIDTIEKLRRERVYENKKISGALKQAISAHGPITKVLIGSATKRIVGAVLNVPPPRYKFTNRELYRLFLEFGLYLYLIIKLIMYLI